MDVVTVVLAGLALAFAGISAFLWSARRGMQAQIQAIEAENESVHRQNASLHDAFDIYRRSHLSLIDAVRPRTLTDEQRFGLRLHLRDLSGVRVLIRVATDTEPGLYAADLCNALVAAGAKAELDTSGEAAIGDKGVEGTIQMAQNGRTRLLRAALKSFAYPLADREVTLARGRRKGSDEEEPEVVVTLGSRRVPPELMDLPPPPKPEPVKKAGPKIRNVTSTIGAPAAPTE